MKRDAENRVNDASVTGAYRAMANERAPAHLDEKVLKMAAAAASPYARARAWMRPVAWAATIALSFAFVLELSQLPSTDLNATGAAQSTDSDTLDQQVIPSEDVAAKVGRLAPQSLPPASIEPADSQQQAERKRASTSTYLDAPVKDEFALREMTVLQDAEELARAQAGSDPGPKAVRAAASTPSTLSADDVSAELAAQRRDEADRQLAKRVNTEAHSAAAAFEAIVSEEATDQACPAAVRETPETWTICIRELRESGRDKQAEDEYIEFRQVFPDFDDSDTDK